MGSLFQGTPQTATSYTTSTTETPKWMQDAIYNQIQIAQNIANRPFEAYEMPTVAELSPLQQQAYQKVQENVDFWKPTMGKAVAGMEGFSTKGTADQLREEQARYLRQDLVNRNLDTGQQLFGRAAGMDIVGAAQPFMQQAERRRRLCPSGRWLRRAPTFRRRLSRRRAASGNTCRPTSRACST
jgi:hypothetical protein